MEFTDIAAMLIHKIERRTALGDQDRAALAALPYRLRTAGPSTYLLREGQQPQRCAFIVDGFAYRQKLTPNGEREIVSILIPNDFVDFQNLFLDESDHDVQTLTKITVAEIPVTALRDVSIRHPAIARAMWVDVLTEASIHREWLLNVGRRDARTRLAHMLCEFQVRLKFAGRGEDTGYELPMTQEQLGDALGLTSVHVNRILKTLERDGLIARQKRQISVTDWGRLRDVAEFNERYLHLTNNIN